MEHGLTQKKEYYSDYEDLNFENSKQQRITRVKKINNLYFYKNVNFIL